MLIGTKKRRLRKSFKDCSPGGDGAGGEEADYEGAGLQCQMGPFLIHIKRDGVYLTFAYEE